MAEREQVSTVTTLGDDPKGEAGSATLTFLIADVRGYTSFTRERGDTAAAALAKKFAALAREAVEARSGRVIELRGDEALAVFTSAPQAVRAAVELQATCAEESRSEPAFQLPIGIGIDAGEAIPVEDGYRGVALNMAARLCSSAGAGQVLVTRTVTDLCEGVDDVVFADRGRATFKGFEEPVEVIEAMATARPELHPGAGAPSTPAEPELLPPELDPLTPMVGRERELLWLRGTWRQTRRGHGRVLVVSGPEQIGKTRLAGEIAAHVEADGGKIRYVGPGGAATAMALAAIRATRAPSRPTLLVLDDVDVAGPTVAQELMASFDELSGRPILVLALLRDQAASPDLAAVIERADERGDGHRILAALDLDGVRGIVRLYAGEDEPEAPVESMARASQGVPGLVHEVASEWARSEASRRLAAAAEFLAAGRDRHASDLEFANNVIGLKLGRLYNIEGRDVLPVETCPYKGLAAFEEDDSAYFFGRERLVGELAARIVQAGLLGVVGASGSGKSSVIAAGLVPSLKAGLLPGSERWTHVSMRPGDHPVDELRRALSSEAEDPLAATIPNIAIDERLVLVVDQFEETFTTCAAEDERAAFIEVLTGAAKRWPDRVAVILAIRGDYYAHGAPYPELAEALAPNHVLVAPLSLEELRRAIELPARRGGLRVESGLTEALVAEVADEPGGLPLLSTALVELWQAGEAGWIRMEAYERTGGVRGAVARLAESSYGQLSDSEQDAARRVFHRLVATGEGEAVTRRRVSLEEFDLARDAAAASVIAGLTQDRLLTMGEDTVEVAHEALLREWPRLRGWLEDDAQGRHLRQHLTQASRQWQSGREDPSELYRGARLSAALDWSAEHASELNELEREYLGASRQASEREAERQRRTNRRLRGLLAGIAVFLVVALVAGSLALIQRGNARRSAAEARHGATVALGKSLGAQALVEPRLDTALLLARESVRLAVNQQTRSTLLSTLLRSPAAIGALYGDGNRPLFISLSPDERVLAIAENTETILFRDTRTGSYAYPPIKRFNVQGILYAPDGTLVVPRVDEGFVVTGLDVMDPSSGRVVRTLPVPKPLSSDPSLSLFAMRFSPDGRMLAIALSNENHPAATSYVVKWDFPGGRLAGPVSSLPSVTNGGLGYAADGRSIVAVGAKVWVIDSGGRRLKTYKVGPEHSAAVSPDGRTVLLGHDDGSVTFVDLVTDRRAKSIAGHSAAVQSAGFTPDGKTAITTGDDRKVLLWDVTTHSVKDTFTGHAGRVLAQTVSRDDRTLYTASLDGTVLVWDLSGDRRFGRSFRASAGDEGDFGPAPHVAVSSDGKMVAVGDASGNVNLWDLESLSKIDSWQAIPGEIGNLQFSPDGASILVSGDAHGPNSSISGFVRIERVSGSHDIVLDLHPPSAVTWSTFGPGGNTVASSLYSPPSSDAPNPGGWAIWDASTGKLLLKRVDYPASTNTVAYSADGSKLAFVGSDRRTQPPKGVAIIVDLPSGRVERQFEVGTLTPILSVDLSPDATMIATGPWDGHVQLWNVATGSQVGKSFKASDGAVTSVQFSPDGREIVTGGTDGTTRLFDVATQQQIGSEFPGQDNGWEFADFTPDSSTIVVNFSSGRTYVWPATVVGWAQHACAVGRRNFTRAEWDQFVPGHPYEKVCPGQVSALSS